MTGFVVHLSMRCLAAFFWLTRCDPMSGLRLLVPVLPKSADIELEWVHSLMGFFLFSFAFSFSGFRNSGIGHSLGGS